MHNISLYLGIFISALALVGFYWTVIQVAEMKYKEPKEIAMVDRLVSLETNLRSLEVSVKANLEALQSKLSVVNSDDFDALRQDVSTLKVQQGFRTKR